MYLNRPIFQFPINWRDAVNKSFTYDLKEVQLGFGAEYFMGQALNVVQGFEVTCDLRGDDVIAAFDAFTAELNGRLVGFWFPAPVEAMQIVAVVSTTVFKISAQGLVDTWDDHPDIHLYFTSIGVNPAAAQIASVVANGDGTETVTLTTPVSLLTGSIGSVSVCRLHYVRLAEDEEKAVFAAEGWQRRSVRVLELPTEYAHFETGEQRIFLFHFYAQAPMGCDWYYTNFAADVASQGVLFSRFEMEHGSLTRDLKLSALETEISARYSPDHPFALMLPIAFPKPLWVEIFSVSFDDLDTRRREFAGRVVSVEDVGDRLKAKCQSLIWALNKKIPGPYIGPNCPWALYDPKTCKVLRSGYDCGAVILALDSISLPPTVTVALDLWTADRGAVHYFAQGWIEAGAGINHELRTVLDSKLLTTDPTVITLILNAPLLRAAVGDHIQVVPGCDGTAASCQNKFHNYANFGGFPAVPTTNPALTAQQATSPGGKK